MTQWNAADSVTFFSPDAENGWLANFSPHEITLGGHHWKTVEHYYQAMKFPPGPLRTRIANAAGPAEAKAIAKTNEAWRRPDWAKVSMLIMYNGIRAKFAQHVDLKRNLLSTAPRVIQEASPTDRKWGIGTDGTGANRMGRLLMALRDRLGEE